MNDPDRTVMWPNGIGDDLPEHLWADGNFMIDGDSLTGDPTDRLVGLAFIKAALKRRRRVWYALAILGLVIGAGLYVDKPELYQANTTILLNDGSNMDTSTAIATDAALAQSTALGSAVIRQLGLPGSVTTFLGSYVVTTPSSNQVLVITASAPTSDKAVREAAAIANEFLTLRASYARTEQTQTETSLNQELALAKQSYNLISSQVSEVSSQPSSPEQRKQLATLQTEQQAANSTLDLTQQNVTSTTLTTRAATQVEIDDSRVINVAEPLKHSQVKNILLYIGGGLVGGLVLGLAIVAIAALTSNRLRRRDDVAYALGSPVKLSVGPLRAGRLPSLSGKDRKRRARDLKHVADYLQKTIPVRSNRAVGLAVIAVDDAQAAAQPVVALAQSCAQQGLRVLLADLSRGSATARALNLSQPGVHRVTSNGAELTVAILSSDDVAPVGPISDAATAGSNSQLADGALADAGAAADLVLTLVTLDPAVGGEHLRTWASVAVAMVTAGGSTTEQIRAASDMLRVAGLRLDSAVLIGADESDESLGLGSDR